VALFLFLDAIWFFDVDGNPIFRLAPKPPEVRKVILIRDRNKHSAKAKEKLVTLKAALDRLALDELSNFTASSDDITLHSSALNATLEKTLAGLKEPHHNEQEVESLIGDNSDSDSDVPVFYSGEEEDPDIRNLRLLIQENSDRSSVREPELADVKRDIIQASFPPIDDTGEVDLIDFNPFENPEELSNLMKALEAENERNESDNESVASNRAKHVEIISEAYSSVRRADSRLLEEFKNEVVGPENAELGEVSSSAIFDIDSFYEEEEDLIVGTMTLSIEELLRPKRLLRTIRGRQIKGSTDLDTLILTIERTSVLGSTWADTKAWNSRIKVLNLLKSVREGQLKKEEIEMSKEDLKWFILPLIMVPVSVFHSVDLSQDLYHPSYNPESGRIIPGEEKMIDESIRNVLSGRLQGNLTSVVSSLEDPSY